MANITASIYDPQVKFLEIGVNVNGVWAYKVYGPDLNGVNGGLQGTGGLEATIMNGTGTATGVINDAFGNGVATISGGSVTWSPTHVGGYGPLPDSAAQPLTDATQLAQDTVWRSRRIDPTGFYYLGSRYYEPTSGRFLSCDPFGYVASTSLYEFCSGDSVNRFDPDGRDFATWSGAGTSYGNWTNQPTVGPPMSPREELATKGAFELATGASGVLVGIGGILSAPLDFGAGFATTTTLFGGFLATGAGYNDLKAAITGESKQEEAPASPGDTVALATNNKELGTMVDLGLLLQDPAELATLPTTINKLLSQMDAANTIIDATKQAINPQESQPSQQPNKKPCPLSL
jgi:RHS repeat-associated protein